MDAKRTKRTREDGEQSLEDHINARRQTFVKEREGASALLTQATELRTQATGLTHRWQRRMQKQMISHAQHLETEAAERRSMRREHAFEQTVVSYLRTYHQQTHISHAVASATHKRDAVQAYLQHTDAASQRKTAIVDEYLTEMNAAPSKVIMCARDECPRCPGAVKLLLCSTRSVCSCPTCGYCVTYLDATSSHTAFDEVVEYSQYSYKRVNHMMMHITLVQGKEAHQVPQEILDQVMHDLYTRQRVRDVTDITQRRVRESLRRLKLRKAYDHVTQVTARISGIRPPRISAATEEQLKNLFLQMQPAFQRHAPKSRTNFLSYSYVLYRCFQMLGLHHMLESITLLKGRDKLEANDAIFRKMAEDLGWPVYDLPPVEVA